MTPVPSISAVVTFLLPEEGGRPTPVRDAWGYRPHLVVGDPSQRKAIVTAGRECTESYLGVGFDGNGALLVAGQPHTVTLSLIYFPDVDYSALVAGATFTIREGGFVVGFGHVVEGISDRLPQGQ